MPWRPPSGPPDPYRVWISEVMLQQTRLETVIPYYRRFLARFPTLAALASAREEEVLAAFSGLGYYARGRNLLRAARSALAAHGGLPASVPALLELPGFGPYTAGAVASIAFGIPEVAVDGNAARVLSRLFGVPGDSGSPRKRRELSALARTLLCRDRPGDVNQSLMELGATLCLPRAPRCERCPVARDCAAFRHGRTGSIPPPRRRARRRPLWLALARLERGGRLLLWRRPEPGLFGGLWQLPGVELECEEGARARLREALRAFLGASCRVGDEVATLVRALTHRDLVLRVYRCELPEVGRLEGRPDLRFAAPDELGELGLATAMRRAIEASGGVPKVPGRARAGPTAAGRRRRGKGGEGP